MTDLSSLATSRQITLRTVVRILLDRGAVSRAELARLTGLSKQTMSEVFRDLEDGGWVQLAGRTQGAVGRSAAVYEVCADRALVFGADVGGTKIQAALADMRGRIVSISASRSSGSVAHSSDESSALSRSVSRLRSSSWISIPSIVVLRHVAC